jgi:hypothetical protein
MAVLSKVNYRVNVFPIKIPNTFFYRNKKITPKIHMAAQKTQNSQSNPEQKEKCGSIKILDYKLYYRAMITKPS